MTAGLFGPRAGLVALFALNAAPFFFASAGTWIVPDGPLLFGLAAAAWALARLFFQTPVDRAGVWALWLVAGVALGLAGLSKYSAALTVVGLVAFVAVSPRRRRWLADPAPYVAAAVALAHDRARRRLERPPRMGVVRLPGRPRSGRRAD